MRNYFKSITTFIIIILLFVPALNLIADNDNINTDPKNVKKQIEIIDSALALVINNQGFNNDSFLILAKQTLNQAKKYKYQKGINQCYFYIARIFDIRNNTDSATRYYVEGLEYDIHNKDLYADYLIRLAGLYRITGNLSSSLEKSLTLKTLVESNQTKKYAYSVYNLLALCYLGLMEYDLAFDNFAKSAELALQHDNEAYAGVVYSNIGKLFYDLYKLNEALEYFEKGVKLEEKYKLYSSAGNSFNIIADIYLKLNNQDSTQFYLEKAKANNLKSNNLRGLANTYYGYSKIHIKSYKSDSAIFYLSKTIDLATKLNYNSVLKDAYLSLSKIYSNKKDFEKAYYYHDLFFNIHNKIYDVEKINKAKAIEQRLIQQKKESEIIELQLKKQKTENRLLYTVVILGFLAGVIATIYLILFKKINTKLTLSKEKAEESDMLKSQFLQTISHEIRTPLNGIIGFSEMILSKSLSDDELAQINDLILKNSDDLISTIENLVDIAHLSTNQYNIRKSKFELTTILDSVIFQAQNNVVFKNKKDLNIQIKKNGEVKLYTDKTIILKIILQLVKNAILYTEKGTITLGYKEGKTNVILYVKDTGIGISKEKIDIIFSPFRQADENINIKVGGTGLGLTIVNEFIQKLGGKIWVGSELKKGSTFFLSLPLK
ncbi:MAG: tetratricopeptide repeat-containing sensor histidine kinase [Bacteroidales bacterium]|nr:tetratricopeptide repeat-containing sensor histidine kinase [Bacteroidales bacterium]